MTKKIKSFTVDEDVYNRLVSMFKKHGAETSISMYLNNQVKWLIERLEDLEKGIKEMNYSIPMSFVIDKIVTDSERSGRLSNEPDQEGIPISELEMDLNDFQESYEAHEKCIPELYYGLLQTGNYLLSKDKNFVIEKKTGKKYISLKKGELMEIREIDSENKR